MSRSYRHTAVLAITTALALVALILSSALAADAAVAKPVSLSDARTAPDFLRALKPGRTVTVTRQCPRGGYWMETSAYRGRGGALGGQRWTSDHTVTYWPAAYGGRVTFDGITFANRTTRTVLVGGWC